jgi:hypothetical protein
MRCFHLGALATGRFDLEGAPLISQNRTRLESAVIFVKYIHG